MFIRSTLIATVAFCSVVTAPLAAIAGDFGVYNRYNFSHRLTTGVQTIEAESNSVLSEKGNSFTTKNTASTAEGQFTSGTAGSENFKTGNYDDTSEMATTNSNVIDYSIFEKAKMSSTANFIETSGSFGHEFGSSFSR